ncbi:MAG: type II toxin-antitoxin system RelE/ParE family toxin [Gemmataceae bacterium]
MSRYHFSYHAEQDLNDIYDYVARFSPTNAARLVQRLQQVCRLLTQFPHLGTARDDLRSGMLAFVEGNYVIFYEATDDGIRILRVLHGSRNILASHFQFP